MLEDNELRGRAMKRKLLGLGYEVAWVRSTDDAMAELRATSEHGGRFHLATLDYDLGTGTYGDALAYWIAGAPEELRPERVEIHSSDDDGAALMMRILTAAGVPATRTEIR